MLTSFCIRASRKCNCSTFETLGQYRSNRARESTSRSFSRGLPIVMVDLCSQLRDREEERVSVAPDKERNISIRIGKNYIILYSKINISFTNHCF